MPDIDEVKIKMTLGSFLQFQKDDAEFDAMYPEEAPMPPTKASGRFEPASLPPIGGRFDVPITIGRSR